VGNAHGPNRPLAITACVEALERLVAEGVVESANESTSEICEPPSSDPDYERVHAAELG
jgi:hypothetical protein